MDKKGIVRKVFPGSNSAFGFFSFYDQIIGPDAVRIFMIKGGPGVGKSTLMKKIGEEMLSRGYDLEYHYCSSDPQSLDGLVVPGLRIAIMDGTAPHIVDPRHPGAVDEIIHLGNFWDEAGIRKNKTSIIRITSEIGRLFQNAYRHLSTTKSYLEAMESYYSLDGILNKRSLDFLGLELLEEILTGKTAAGGGPGKIRRLFASAITPEGPINYLDSLVNHLISIYIIHGDYRTGKRKIIESIMDGALMRGFYVEAYHCALDPDKVDHIIIPELGAAVFNSLEPHYFTGGESWREIDTAEFIASFPKDLQAEHSDFTVRYRSSLKEAISFLTRAKAAHDELEEYYIPNMNFAEIDRVCRDTLERIFEYTR
ncbi:MAG: PRK06851 family protein [Bacillota bacterium]|nr:PRK06851 family protein [Bacillota bacterium]